MANPGVASSSVTNLLPVQAEYDANGNCLGLYGQGGNPLQTPLNATNISIEGNLLVSGANPTIASGFGVGPSILANSTAAFKITVGTGTTAYGGVINFPAAPNGWIVYAADVTSGSSLFLQQTGSTQTSATIASYGITTGTATAMSAGDTILITAFAY